jgi:hypothetical protein
MVSMEWAMSLRHLIIPPEIGLEVRGLAGDPIDDMRNKFVDTALKAGHDYLFFNDDDTLLPPKALERLLERNLDIVSGLYYRRVPPLDPVAFVDDPTVGGTGIAPIKSHGTGLMPVDYVGAGCLLISRKVLEAIQYPWFKWSRNDQRIPLPERISEDLYFCKKAREAGFQIHLDASVRCLHVGMGMSQIGGTFIPSTQKHDKDAFGVVTNPVDQTVSTE